VEPQTRHKRNCGVALLTRWLELVVNSKGPEKLESEIRGESHHFCSHSFHADSRVQALILSPTRELATQTQKVILAMGDHLNIQAHACIGGTSLGEDIRKLEYGVHVVSGTPGRVYDMIKRRTLRTRAIKVLILVRRPAPLCVSQSQVLSGK
jgi:hypothetical protein